MDILLQQKILRRIKPTRLEQERLNELVEKVLRKCRRAAKSLGFSVEFLVGGSFGKGTYLRGSSDVDVFCRFSQEYLEETLSEKLAELLDCAGFVKRDKRKGSRDYYSLSLKTKDLSLRFEFVPLHFIQAPEEAKNSVDVSPFHVQFVHEHLKKNPSLADEIRLTKQLLKAQGLYGAESYIQGFSGHVVDILLCHFGSLCELLTQARHWEEQICLRNTGTYCSSKDLEAEMEKEKFSSLVLQDPCLPSRNAARALCDEKYAEFLLFSQKTFELTEHDFLIEKLNMREIIEESKKFVREYNLRLALYSFKINIGLESEDIVGSKMLRLFRLTSKYFENLGLRIFREDFYIDLKQHSCMFSFMFERGHVPKVKKLFGPKVYMGPAVQAFLQKHETYFVEDHRLCTYAKRTSQTIDEAMRIGTEQFRAMHPKEMNCIKSMRRYKV